MLGAGLALLGWAAMPGHVPGAVSVSLSCDDDAVRHGKWRPVRVRRRGRYAEGAPTRPLGGASSSVG